MTAAAHKSLVQDKIKVQDRQDSLFKQAAYIRNQIEENAARRLEERADMSNTEKAMNAKLIQSVETGELNVKEQPFDPKRPFAWRYNYRNKPF